MLGSPSPPECAAGEVSWLNYVDPGLTFFITCLLVSHTVRLIMKCYPILMESVDKKDRNNWSAVGKFLSKKSREFEKRTGSKFIFRKLHVWQLDSSTYCCAMTLELRVWG